MLPLYVFCILLATDLTVDGAPARDSHHQMSFGGSSFFSSHGQQGIIATNEGSVGIKEVDGKVEIHMNGQRIDLEKARVVSENEQYKVLEPKEFPEARVTINKANGQIVVDFRGAHYESMTPEMVKAQMAKMEHDMQKMQEGLKHMQENLSNMFKGFPFVGW